MSFPRYPAYKPSGVEWLGDVPAHWEVRRLRQLADIRTGVAKGKDLGGVEAVEVPYLRVANVQDGFVSLDEVATMPVPKSDLARFCLRRGDVLMNEGGDYDKLGRGCVWNGQIDPCITQNHVFAVRPHGASSEWVSAFTCSKSAQFFFMAMAKQSTNLASISSSNLMELPLPLPPRDEQQMISGFIGRETAKIDALVAEQQRLIDLLKEKRQVVISHAVTKGLNPDAPMKPSGVEWLGEVPAHWEVKPIRKSARLESGHTPSRSHPEYWENCTVPWFTLADVWQIREAGADYIQETKEKVSQAGLANSSARLLPKGTVMLSRTASVGFSAIMGVDMATTQDFANWVCGPSLKPEFLLQVLRSMRSEFDRMMMGSTHNTIYMPDIQALRFALPPVHEQTAIVEFVGGETVKIDTLTAETERAIALLQERRTALISAAVTGQIDVRHLASESAA